MNRRSLLASIFAVGAAKFLPPLPVAEIIPPMVAAPVSDLWSGLWMYSATHATTEFDFMEIFGSPEVGVYHHNFHSRDQG